MSLWGASPELEQAFRFLGTYTWGQSREPLNAIEAAIQASEGDAAARKELETRLAAVLRSFAPFAAKQYACRALSQIGTADSIPVLAPFLADPALSHPARMALERIPDARAAAALRTALPKAEGQAKAGIINSLGVLRDAAAVEPLKELLAGSEAESARAAASALGNIAILEAAKALEQSRDTVAKDLQPAVTQAWLVAAGRLLDAGQRREAARIYTRLHRGEEAVHVRVAALKGLVDAEPERALDLLAAAMAADNAEGRRVAGSIIGNGFTRVEVRPFVENFRTYSAEAQVALLEAFRSRAEAVARPAALAAAESTNMALRLAGLRALAALGTTADIPMLASRAAGEGEEQAIARAALAGLADRQTDAALVAMLPGSSPDVAVELCNALVARGTESAAPGIAARLRDSNELVRTAALSALGELGRAAQVPAVVASLKTAASEGDRETAQNALTAIAGRAGSGCVDALLEGLEGAAGQSRVALLRTLGVAGGPKALAAVRANLTRGEAAVKEAAFRVLADWSSADAGPELLRLALTSPEPAWRVLAFRGYVRLARESDCPPEERLGLLTEAMKTARDLEERRLVIAAAGEQPDRRVLPLVAPGFEEPALAQETCLAVVTVAARAEPGHKKEVVPYLKPVLKVSTNAEVREQARSLLQRLGEKPD